MVDADGLDIVVQAGTKLATARHTLRACGTNGKGRLLAEHQALPKL